MDIIIFDPNFANYSKMKITEFTETAEMVKAESIPIQCEPQILDQKTTL